MVKQGTDRWDSCMATRQPGNHFNIRSLGCRPILQGFWLGINLEFHTSCESDIEHSKTKPITMPRHDNHVNFDHPHKKSHSIPTLKPSYFRPAHKIKVHFDSRTKTKSVSISTLKPRQFRSPTQKPRQFRPQR